MDNLYEKTLLYDFYGELLTPHQKAVYEAAVMDDRSLSEVAEDYGISRQGVHDLIKRINKSLNEYEDKLHLVARFLDIKKKVSRIQSLTQNDEIRKLTEEVLEEL